MEYRVAELQPVVSGIFDECFSWCKRARLPIVDVRIIISRFFAVIHMF